MVGWVLAQDGKHFGEDWFLLAERQEGEQRVCDGADLAQLALRCILSASLAAFVTACIASVLL